MADYVMNSLTRAAQNQLNTYESEFKLVLNGNEQITSFPLLWKRLVLVPSLDSKTTDTNLRKSIRAMPTKIHEMSIPDWNTLFKSYMTQLEARGSTLTMLSLLFLTATRRLVIIASRTTSRVRRSRSMTEKAT